MFYVSEAWISLLHICYYVEVTKLSVGLVGDNQNDPDFKKVIT